VLQPTIAVLWQQTQTGSAVCAKQKTRMLRSLLTRVVSVAQLPKLPQRGFLFSLRPQRSFFTSPITQTEANKTAITQSDVQLDSGDRLFAVVQSGGKQFKVTPGDLVLVDKMLVDIGEDILLQKVLLVGGKKFSIWGRPIISEATVSATVEEQVRAEKKITFKRRRRKNSQRTRSSRAELTALRITGINVKIPSLDELLAMPDGLSALQVQREQMLLEAQKLAAAPLRITGKMPV